MAHTAVATAGKPTTERQGRRLTFRPCLGNTNAQSAERTAKQALPSSASSATKTATQQQREVSAARGRSSMMTDVDPRTFADPLLTGGWLLTLDHVLQAPRSNDSVSSSSSALAV